MTIAGALSSALSGLTAAARGAEIVSSNIANARTEGYGRRELQLSARNVGHTGQGVQVSGVLRRVDPAVIGERRQADSAEAEALGQLAFFKALETAIGTPDSPSSLSGRVAAFDAALIAAASRPDSEARLDQVFGAAAGLAAQIRTASEQIRAARTQADAQIGQDVDTLNRALSRVAELNSLIRAGNAGGNDHSALIDQRQQAIDQIAQIVPLREITRDSGTVALFTTGGAILLDGSAVELGFTAAGTVTAGMTLGAPLSAVTANGRPLSIQAVSGGRLAASLAVRDELAPAAQTKLDAVARDLIDRFADPSLDPSLAPGAAGLFTDAGSPFLVANELGLASRISLNSRVDPASGGGLWRLRDGIGQSTPGASGNPGLLVALQSRLTEARSPVSGGFMPGTRSFASLGADLVSSVASDRLSAESDRNFAAARAEGLKTLELENGVDTDQELQTLLLIEQIYAANARIIKVVDDMIQQLLGL
jgi:flagellar hook-associated protein 1 FlgK